MNKPEKRYIVWTLSEYGMYAPSLFDTIEEALVSNKYTDDWYLTEAINDITAYGNYSKPKPEEKKEE